MLIALALNNEVIGSSVSHHLLLYIDLTLMQKNFCEKQLVMKYKYSLS